MLANNENVSHFYWCYNSNVWQLYCFPLVCFINFTLFSLHTQWSFYFILLPFIWNEYTNNNSLKKRYTATTSWKHEAKKNLDGIPIDSVIFTLFPPNKILSQTPNSFELVDIGPNFNTGIIVCSLFLRVVVMFVAWFWQTICHRYKEFWSTKSSLFEPADNGTTEHIHK